MRVIKQFLGVPNLRRSTPSMFMHFLPGISLVTLRRQFVAEVRWLFPVSRQKKRESGKQRNTEPWRWDLNENTAFSEISATCSPINIANILSKSSVPVYCLFVFACLFFLLWLFVGSSYSLFISPLQDTETGSKDEHSKNKWQNINCYKSSKILCMLSWFCVSNGTRSLSKNITLPSVQAKLAMLCQKK